MCKIVLVKHYVALLFRKIDNYYVYVYLVYIFKLHNNFLT